MDDAAPGVKGRCLTCQAATVSGGILLLPNQFAEGAPRLVLQLAARPHKNRSGQPLVVSTTDLDTLA